MKTLIAIPTCHIRNYLYRTTLHLNAGNKCVDWIRATWWNELGAYPLDGKFFYGRGLPREPLRDEVFLDCADDYAHLFDKIRAMFAWCLQAGYETVLKCDDDVLVRVDRVVTALRDVQYRGTAINKHEGCYAAGHFYQIGWEAMKAVVEAETPPVGVREYEDKSVGYILRRAGIRLEEVGYEDCNCLCPHCVHGFEAAHVVHVENPATRDLIASTWRASKGRGKLGADVTT